MKYALAMVAILAACKKEPPSPAATAAVATPCTESITKAIDTMIAKKQAEGSDQFTAERRERLEKLRAVLGNRCTADKWSPAMLGCVAAIDGQPGLMACMHGNLDPDASQRLSADIATVMFGMRRNNGAGGPPTGGEHFHANNFDIVSAFEKRLAEITAKVDVQQKLVAAASTDADRSAATTELTRLTRERDELAKQLVQLRATHGGDLKDMKPSTAVPGGSGSAK